MRRSSSSKNVWLGEIKQMRSNTKESHGVFVTWRLRTYDILWYLCIDTLLQAIWSYKREIGNDEIRAQEKVCKVDYFLSRHWAEFQENARLLIFETYCRQTGQRGSSLRNLKVL